MCQTADDAILPSSGNSGRMDIPRLLTYSQWLFPRIDDATMKSIAAFFSGALLCLGAALVALPAGAEEAAARAPAGTTLLGNSLNWRGDVDRAIEVSLRHRSVRVNVLAGRSLRRQHQDSRVEGFLPARPVTVRLENVEGPGTVEIVEQPTEANNYTALVRITNNEPSRTEFRFALRW